MQMQIAGHAELENEIISLADHDGITHYTVCPCNIVYFCSVIRQIFYFGVN